MSALTIDTYEQFRIKGHRWMTDFKALIKPEIAIGSIAAIVINLTLGGAWLLNDSYARAEQKETLHIVSNQLEDIRLALPVITNKIEVNGGRITTLEQQEHTIEIRIVQLEQFQAMTRQTLDELRQNYLDLVHLSQIQAQSAPYKNKR